MPFEETKRCWKEILEGFLEFGFSKEDIEFELLEKRSEEYEQFRLFDSNEEAFVAIFKAIIFEEFLAVNEKKNGYLDKLFDPRNNFYSKIDDLRYQITGRDKKDLTDVQRAFAATLSEYREETIEFIKKLGGMLYLKSFLRKEIKESSGGISLKEIESKFSRIVDRMWQDVRREKRRKQREISEPGHEKKKNRTLQRKEKIRKRVLVKLLKHFKPNEVSRMKVSVYYEKRDKSKVLVKQYIARVSLSKLRSLRNKLGLGYCIEVRGTTAKEIVQKLNDELPEREG